MIQPRHREAYKRVSSLHCEGKSMSEIAEQTNYPEEYVHDLVMLFFKHADGEVD